MTDPRPGLDRRAFLRLTAVGVGAGTVVTLTGCSIFDSREPINTVGKVDFRNRLHIPPLAESTRSGGETVFALTAQAGRTSIVPAGQTETWGFNAARTDPACPTQ